MAYGNVGTGIQSPAAQLVATMNAITQKYVVPVLGDNVLSPSPAFWLMTRNGKHIQGGEIVYPLLTMEETTGGAYYGDQLLNTAVQDSIAPATQVWRPYYESSAIPVTDAIMNRGEAGILPLMQTKFQIACGSLLQKLSRALWHTTPQNTSIDIDDLISWVATQNNTIAGINRSTSAYFNPPTAISGASIAASTLEHAYQQVVFGYDEPDIALVDYAVYYKIKNLFTTNNRYTDNIQDDDAMQAGFRYHFVFNNSIMMPDRFATSGDLLFLNSKYIYPVFHEDDYFTVAPLIMPSNQRVVVANIFVMWQLICLAPRMNIAITSIS